MALRSSSQWLSNNTSVTILLLPSIALVGLHSLENSDLFREEVAQQVPQVLGKLLSVEHWINCDKLVSCQSHLGIVVILLQSVK